mmetsp:Transcript_32370/g.59838  ORF Transcript_32370/g.59838 Transcript_32370/m.59838 type:complete len:94 (-) Transcript_32370:191-472(-)
MMKRTQPSTMESSHPTTINASNQRAFFATISLLASFLLGSVVILTVTFLWHSELVMETATIMHSNIMDCPLFRLGCSLCRRRGRGSRQFWMLL